MSVSMVGELTPRGRLAKAIEGQAAFVEQQCAKLVLSVRSPRIDAGQTSSDTSAKQAHVGGELPRPRQRLGPDTSRLSPCLPTRCVSSRGGRVSGDEIPLCLGGGVEESSLQNQKGSGREFSPKSVGNGGQEFGVGAEGQVKQASEKLSQLLVIDKLVEKYERGDLPGKHSENSN